MISIRALKHLALAMGIGLATIGATAFAPTDAVAQDTDKISMQFVGFGANPDFYAILQSSKLGGKALVIYQIGGQGPKLVYPLNKTSLEAALQSKEVAVFGINANYVAGMAAPAGYKLGGMVIGETLQLTLSSGEQSMTLGYAPIFSNPTKTKVADMSIVNAFWTPDSKRVVIILHQKLDGDWPVDSDVIAAYTLG